MNKERLSRGISALRVDPTLTQAAESRSVILAREGRIYHVSAPAGTPWPELWQAGYEYTLAGENLALGIESPSELQARWMASPSHRDNIVNASYQDVGVGVTVGTYAGRPASYVVVFFGSPVSRPNVVARAVAAVPHHAPTETTTTVSSTVRASDTPASPTVLAVTSTQNESSSERVRLMTKLISLLESYLLLLSANAGSR